MKLRKLLLMLALPALMCAQQAKATFIELGIGIDESGSISPVQFGLVKSGLISALNDTSLLPHDGSIAVGLFLYTFNTRRVFDTAPITDANFDHLISVITGLTQRAGGPSATALAISDITTNLLGNDVDSDRQIIDIWTDGPGNAGNEIAAAHNAILAGIEQINCLSISAVQHCDVATGTGSQEDQVTTGNSGIGAAIHNDLAHDLTLPTSDVPEPASIALMGVALAALGLSRRMRT